VERGHERSYDSEPFGRPAEGGGAGWKERGGRRCGGTGQGRQVQESSAEIKVRGESAVAQERRTGASGA